MKNFQFFNLETAVGSQKSAQALGALRSLSKIRRIYYGCAGFGQIFRSFSLNRHDYSPQTIETSDSNQHPLATIPHLGQAPRRTWHTKKMSPHHGGFAQAYLPLFGC